MRLPAFEMSILKSPPCGRGLGGGEAKCKNQTGDYRSIVRLLTFKIVKICSHPADFSRRFPKCDRLPGLTRSWLDATRIANEKFIFPYTRDVAPLHPSAAWRLHFLYHPPRNSRDSAFHRWGNETGDNPPPHNRRKPQRGDDHRCLDRVPPPQQQG